MVKTPRAQHSKSTKEPVTIDLPPGEVSRVKAEAEAEGKDPAPGDEPQAVETNAVTDAPASPASNSSEPATPVEKQATTSTASVPPISPKPTASAPTSSDDKPKAAEEREKVRSTVSSSPSAASPGAFGRRDPEPAAGSDGSGFRMAVAGFIGGLIVLILAGALQFGGLLPAAVNANQQAEIEALRTELVQLSGDLEAAGDSGAAALDDRLAQAEEQIAALSSEVETLRSNVADAATPDIALLEERIAAIETAIAGLGEAEAPVPALAAVEEEIAGLGEAVAVTREAQEAASGRLDALEEALAALQAQVEEQAQAPATATILAATSLKSAIDRGEPFAAELDAYAALAPEAPEIGQLREFAEEGVPTRAEIAAQADAAASAMIEAARPGDPQAGFFGRLWNSAQGMVNVRPVGMIEGEGAPETIARLEAAIEAGDYARAVQEYESLPEEARQAGQDFMAKVRARQSADNLIDQAMAAALRS